MSTFSFHFPGAWSDAVYLTYPSGTPAIKFALMNAVSNIVTIQTLFPGIVRMQTSVTLDDTEFQVGVGLNQGYVDSWPA